MHNNYNIVTYVAIYITMYNYVAIGSDFNDTIIEINKLYVITLYSGYSYVATI